MNTKKISEGGEPDRFWEGDLVMVGNLPDYMRYHRTGRAIVLSSEPSDWAVREYVLFFEGSGHSAWYQQSVLELIERQQYALLEEWEFKRLTK